MAQPPDAFEQSASVASPLWALVAGAIDGAGGWLPFDRFMALALYAPGLGYYSNASRKFGQLPGSGSDFVTAPEMSALFGQALAAQVGPVLQACGSGCIFEFGAGSGALAEQLLDSLDNSGIAVQHYRIIDLSASLRERQAQRLARFGERVQWLDAWPEAIDGVVIGNELLDAMPVQLLHFDGDQWFERGVALASDRADGLAWADRPTALRPPVPGPFAPGTVTEIHPQAEAFVRSLAERLRRGLALFIDYGFPEHEYYHPQRVGGTLMCHQAHQADANPLAALGQKDITAHVNFSAMALAGQDAGLEVAGYTSQARFLLNCGLGELMEKASLRERSMAHRLLAEHEMGELFKVIAFSRDLPLELIGFSAGDRSHRL